MNLAPTITHRLQTGMKPPFRAAIRHSTFQICHSFAPLSPQTPSHPVSDPRLAPTRPGPFKSNFLAVRADALAGLNWAGETAFGLVPGIGLPNRLGTALSTGWTLKGYIEESTASTSAAQLRRQRHNEWATLQKALGQQERNYSRLKSQYERECP
jgi:hypothetical protein